MKAATRAILVILVSLGPCPAEETLPQAWGIAISQNPSLHGARLEAGALRQESEAVASGQWPAVSMRTGYLARTAQPGFRGSQPGVGVFAFPSAQQNAATYSAQLTAPLWTAGRIENSVASTESRYLAGAAGVRWEEMQLRLKVAEAYMAILCADAWQAAAEQALVAAQAESDNAVGRAAQQRASKTDVLAARVALEEAKHRANTSENAATAALAEYNQLLGRPPNFDCRPAFPALPLLGLSRDQMLQRAIAVRPDVRALQATFDSLKRESDSWRAAMYPQVNAELGYAFEDNDFQTRPGIGVAGVFVDWNVFDAGSRRHKSEAASGRAAATLAALRDLQSQIAVEVLRAWNSRSDAISAERAAAAGLDYAFELDRSIQQRCMTGAAMSSETIASRSSLAEARARYLEACTNRVLAELRLRYAAGML
ncbi:TolC family protein [Botrimarina mediterranea]|uniref:Outer membrane channel protein n=1 Tax=Botrimarina mediterranea TaxID=2528022 RepID=A0A518KBF1_9BACT|nr:TolC family protein [Botrimarina mediterranea]QDV75099.1 outer membrane channel protein [Botrimarina mediterranea]QDV79745.1 outer membrane channel protein [Planctomycetes bacterium K2D]